VVMLTVSLCQCWRWTVWTSPSLKCCFLFCIVACLHLWWSETFWHYEVQNSFLVNVVQKCESRKRFVKVIAGVYCEVFMDHSVVHFVDVW